MGHESALHARSQFVYRRIDSLDHLQSLLLEGALVNHFLQVFKVGPRRVLLDRPVVLLLGQVDFAQRIDSPVELVVFAQQSLLLAHNSLHTVLQLNYLLLNGGFDGVLLSYLSDGALIDVFLDLQGDLLDDAQGGVARHADKFSQQLHVLLQQLHRVDVAAQASLCLHPVLCELVLLLLCLLHQEVIRLLLVFEVGVDQLVEPVVDFFEAFRGEVALLDHCFEQHVSVGVAEDRVECEAVTRTQL